MQGCKLISIWALSEEMQAAIRSGNFKGTKENGFTNAQVVDDGYLEYLFDEDGNCTIECPPYCILE